MKQIVWTILGNQDAESVRIGNSPRYQSTSVFHTSSDGQGDGVPKACRKQAARTRKGPEPACVLSPLRWRVARREGRMNWHLAVVPSSRRGQNLQLVAKEEEPGFPKRVSGRHVVWGTTVLTYPCPSQPCFGSKGCARVTGKAGENGQNSGAGRQLTLDKTVASRVWWHSRL